MSKAIPLGPFELESPIGQGGMGEIWRARHVEQAQLVAVKVMVGSHSREESYQEVFRNEVRAVAALDHPASSRSTTTARFPPKQPLHPTPNYPKALCIL